MDNSVNLRLLLTNGGYCIVSSEDFAELCKHKWHKLSNGYSARRAYPSKKYVLMHREIMNAPKGKEVDHKNGNKLDNTRQNLRLCTGQQNKFNTKKPITNTSGFKGVYRIKNSTKWMAQISFNDKSIYLGMYNTKKEAATVYNNKAMELYGEFACLNEVQNG